jgi:anti-sigma regulatory factor (Ser/Thr protein kinase)
VTILEACARMADHGEWTVEIPGDVHALGRVREFGERIASDLELDRVTAFEIKVALNEAATNAVVHGCRTSADRVHVRATADAGVLVVDVVDPGGTFAPMAGPVDPLAPSGRGTVLLDATTDDLVVDVGPGRTTVRFLKRLHRVDAGDRRDRACAAALL